VYAVTGSAPQKLGSRGREVGDVWSHAWSSMYEPAGSDELKSASSNWSTSGSGLIGLRDRFSLKAVGRGKLVIWPVLDGSKGMVSDLFILFRTFWYLEDDVGMLPIRCLLVEAGGEGRRVAVVRFEERRVCESEGRRASGFLLRDGIGRLLKVRLRGMPPMGSSGRQT
jgi:hypothetical protein